MTPPVASVTPAAPVAVFILPAPPVVTITVTAPVATLR
jgi:hypothetical protein